MPEEVPPQAPDRDLEAAATAHHRMLATIDGALEAGTLDPTRPTELPGWTVGHVLTHLARNADGFTRMFEAAERGEVADQYEGGAEGRAVDIEAGARRDPAALVEDLRRTIWRLEQTWAGSSWRGTGRTLAGGEVPIRELPARRVREVEIHHVDLGMGYRPADWPDAFVRAELANAQRSWHSRRPMGLTDVPSAVQALAPSSRLAWFLGRLHVQGVADAGPWG